MVRIFPICIGIPDVVYLAVVNFSLQKRLLLYYFPIWNSQIKIKNNQIVFFQADKSNVYFYPLKIMTADSICPKTISSQTEFGFFIYGLLTGLYCYVWDRSISEWNESDDGRTPPSVTWQAAWAQRKCVILRFVHCGMRTSNFEVRILYDALRYNMIWSSKLELTWTDRIRNLI
jgi:hypothetical protein